MTSLLAKGRTGEHRAAGCARIPIRTSRSGSVGFAPVPEVNYLQCRPAMRADCVGGQCKESLRLIR
jgi:hypothetical protein